MNAQKCLELLREVKDVAFATVSEDGLPRVRIIDVMLVEDEKLYFCTSRGKSFYRQLLASGQVAVTGMTKDYQMLRLHGSVRRLAGTAEENGTDRSAKEWIDRIFAENPSMNEVYPGESRYILEPFCIADGELEFFDLGKTPIWRECFAIGNAAVKKVGFFITEDCIGCGTCEQNCPQQCIDEGTPYVIRQNNCLHCGLCYENCPVEAIEHI